MSCGLKLALADLVVIFYLFVEKSVKTAVLEDGNPPGALVSTKLVEQSRFEFEGGDICKTKSARMPSRPELTEKRPPSGIVFDLTDCVVRLSLAHSLLLVYERRVPQ